MSVQNSHYLIDRIQRCHWVSQGERVGFSAAEAQALIDDVTSQTDEAIAKAAAELPKTFATDLSDAVFEGMRRLNTRLIAQA